MKKILLTILLIGVVLAAIARLRYGGGQYYDDLSTPPAIDAAALEEVLSYAEPIGGVAVSPDGRFFFTVHPESRPRGNRLLEVVDGAAVPFPDGGAQLDLFDTVLGIAVDGRDRLWTLDHGNHGLRAARLIAFDLETGSILRDQLLPPEIAPAGSYLQDLAVSADGRTIVIADASLWRKSPALIVYDVTTGTARRVLESRAAVSAEPFMIRANERELAWLGGIVALRGGVDGIVLDGDWLYFGALSGSTLYRVALRDLANDELTDEALQARVHIYSSKPLSDGLAADGDGNVFVTDVEHNSVYIVGDDREIRTLVQSGRIRWPGDLTYALDGWLYVADSALPELVLKPREHIAAQRPYSVFRFRPGVRSAPGN